MLCSLIGGEFLQRAMGCFFGCFRVADDRRPPTINLVSQPISSAPKEPVVESVAKDSCLSSLLLFEEKENDQSPCKEQKCGAIGSPVQDINSNELKAEAKFLKACGTIPRTPDEIRNPQKLKDSQPHNGSKGSLMLHPWLQDTTTEKLKLDKQPDQPASPIKLCDEWESGSDSSSHSPNSCVTGQTTDANYSRCTDDGGVGQAVENVDVHANQAQTATPSVTPLVVASVQRTSKTVRFDCPSDASSFSSGSSSSEITNQNGKQSGLPGGDHSILKPSPFPTPLKLTEDMQTPGTVYPACFHNKESGKNARIRSQYVYSVLNPVENLSQLKALREEDFSSYQCSSQLQEYLEQPDKEKPQSQLEIGSNAIDKDLGVEASLSSWLQPQQTHQGCSDQYVVPTSQGLPECVQTPGDRPILGMVAAHWNAEEASSVSPKWWDGNGIPNSTNKYKEDQKVSWHATPFEERLEKALSEDKHIAESCCIHDGHRKELERITRGPTSYKLC